MHPRPCGAEGDGAVGQNINVNDLAAATNGDYLDQLKALSPHLATVLGAMERLYAWA
jgi:hypothetical protein